MSKEAIRIKGRVDTTDLGREQMNEDLDAYRKGTKKIAEEFIKKTPIAASIYNICSPSEDPSCLAILSLLYNKYTI
jgi:hypothetical protein